jgi:PhoH-like ATPase
MPQLYVIDTSVLLSNPKALLNYQEAELVLPIVVVKELEGKRNDPDLGFNARSALRFLESLRGEGGSDLRERTPIPNTTSHLRIELNHVASSRIPDVLRQDGGHDARILSVAAELAENEPVILVSKDLPMRLLASTIDGVKAEDYLGDTVPYTGYTGLTEGHITKDDMDFLYSNKTLPAAAVAFSGGVTPVDNTAVILKGESSNSSAIAICKGSDLRLIHSEMEAFGVKGRSAQQKIAIQHLLNNDVGIVSLGGPGGTGKSMLALAAGLELVLEQRTHKKIVVFRPLFPVGGQELGFLPGTEGDKMHPWAAAVFDALDAFCSKNVINEVMSRNLIEVLPLTHIRGRTFTDTIMILDEAQNLERNVILTALSRAGYNTRIFLNSDVAQRDNLRVGRYDGIASVVEKLKGEKLFAHIQLSRSERSPIAELVTRILDE